MPELMVKETTVYTLAELEELFGASVHQHAIEKICEYEYEGWEPSWFTEDLHEMIKYEFPLFELNQVRQGYYAYNSTQLKNSYRPELYWGMNPYTAEGKGHVAVAEFMRKNKLCNKYRLLWAIMTKYGLDFAAPVAFGHGSSDEVDLSDLESDMEYYDETYQNKPRYAKFQEQLKELADEIDGYVGEIYTKVLSTMRAENDYRWSKEFAKEEAEAHELKFSEDGSIYHG